MIDPPRLRDDAGGSVGEMLSAARADGPRDAASDKRRVLAALAALEGAGAPGMDTRSNVDASPWSRWMLGALAGVGLAVIGAVSMSSSSSTPSDDVAPSAPAASPAPTSAPTTNVEMRAAPAAEIPSIDVVNLPAATASAARRAEAAPKAKDAPASAAVADELAAVERVRAHLAGGDAKGARREIAAYRATFVRGRFVEEVEALEVEALAADGAHADARAKAAEFAARFPSSPYARRVRSVVSSLDEAVTP